MEFYRFLRPEQKFDSLTALQAMYNEVLYSANALCGKFSNGENVLKEDVLRSMEDMTAMTTQILPVLEYYDVFLEAKSSYEDVLDNSTSDDETRVAYVNAIEGATNVSTVTTVAELEAKIVEMEMALQIYILKATPVNGYAFDYTSLVVNPELEDGTIGWIGEMDVNNNQNKWTNVNGGFVEKWKSSGSLNDLNFYQELTGLPEGNYTFTAYVIACKQSKPDTYEVEGVKLYANDDFVEVHTINVDRNETNYAIGAELISVTTSIKEGESLRFGLSVENTDANWVVMDNAKLYRTEYNLPVYTVTFYDWDNTVLKAQNVQEGQSATAPDAPIREGYAFIGWDKDFTNVQENLSIYATYEQTFTVTFYDGQGTVLKVETVMKGQDATPPTPPTREGYVFDRWYGEYTYVQSDRSVYAIYREVIDVVTEYTVKFCDWNGTVLKTQTVQQGQSATAPANPTREGYTFSGWDKELTAVTGNVTFPVQSAAGIKYTIDFYTDGAFGTQNKALTVRQMELFSLAVAIVWDQRMDRNWLNIQAKVHDSSFNPPSEGTYTEKINQRLMRNIQMFNDKCTKYEQDCAFVNRRGRISRMTLI